MNLYEYERKVNENRDKNLENREQLYYLTVGLFGECGEIIDYLKKVHFQQHDFNKNKLTEELGDVLWYLTSIANEHDIHLNDIIFNNFKKMNKRYPTGYSHENSKKRIDINEK